MSIITEVRFGHGDGALADTLESLPEADVTVINEAGTDPGNEFIFWFDIDGEPDLQSVLDDDHTVQEAEPMSGIVGELWKIRFTPETELLSPLVTATDGFVLDARSTNVKRDYCGWRERWLLPDREALRDIWEYARSEGFEFEVVDFRAQGRTDLGYPGRNAPTEQQREALLAAYDRGYFAEPRETSLKELADELGISPTAVGGRLKRGMKSLIAMTIMVEGPDEPDLGN